MARGQEGLPAASRINEGSMYGKRLGSRCVGGCLGGGVLGALSNSAGQSQQPAPALTYGGTRRSTACELTPQIQEDCGRQISEPRHPLEDDQTVTGTITDERVSGTIRTRSIATRPSGRVARCTSRTQTSSAAN